MSTASAEKNDANEIAENRTSGFVQWLQDPMGSVVASSVAVIGSFGLVLSGTWFIHLAVSP